MSPNPKPKAKAKKVKPNHAGSKKAFDAVMETYRRSPDRGMGAQQISDKGHAAQNPAKPSLTDFRCDVQKALAVVFKDKSPQALEGFLYVYVYDPGADQLEIDIEADREFGAAGRVIEARLGAIFIKRKIYPVTGGRGYFNVIRKWRDAK